MLIQWSDDSSFWVRRASLLAHLQMKKKTNTKLLENTIVKLMKEVNENFLQFPSFFRKKKNHSEIN